MDYVGPRVSLLRAESSARDTVSTTGLAFPSELYHTLLHKVPEVAATRLSSFTADLRVLDQLPPMGTQQHRVLSAGLSALLG